MYSTLYMSKVTLFWFRRDLRLEDNAGLFAALSENTGVLPIFIFDENILRGLESNDARVNFIYERVSLLKKELQDLGSDLHVYHGSPIALFEEIVKRHNIDAVYCNHDYEPKARKRDLEIENYLNHRNILFKSFKDQCIFEKDEVLTGQGHPYTVFTPYSRQWKLKFKSVPMKFFSSEKSLARLLPVETAQIMPSLKSLGFVKSEIIFPEQKIKLPIIKNYNKTRDFPFLERGTSHLGLFLRFGVLSIRQLAKIALKENEVFLNELIWRDFFMQILWHYPHVETKAFRPQYEEIQWRHSKKDFTAWCEGKTGYPLVDAGMRELVATGYMHNRVRMVTASFLTKHLLIDWREGEKFFAKHLLDYDLAANNGNWQWAAGCGCDAAPYFRIFNPEAQAKKFDADFIYIKKWLPEYGTDKYPEPIVDHQEARGRALAVYSAALKKTK